jgi:hypothetical protein
MTSDESGGSSGGDGGGSSGGGGDGGSGIGDIDEDADTNKLDNYYY